MSIIKICIVTIFLTIIYIGVSVFISNLLFHSNANGSLIYLDKICIGSKLIGQQFTKNYYFHGRPSLHNYMPDFSGNSNLAYYSSKLKNDLLLRRNYFKESNSTEPTLNLLSESGSGLDPDITEHSALIQIEQIFRATNIDKSNITRIIKETSRPRILGLFGENIVNVLELNLKIKDLYDKKNRA